MKPWIFLLWPALLTFTAGAQDAGVTNLWKFNLPDHGTECSPALAPDGTIYEGTFDGWLLALAPDGNLKWKFAAGLEIKSSPAVAADGTIYFGSRDRKFYALAPDGKLKWSFATGAWVDSSPAIAADGTIYFGSWDKNFYALNPGGELKCKFATGDIVDSSPAIGADGTIYFGSHDKIFYALAPNGNLKWKFATGGEIIASPAIAADGTIYISSTDGNCYALNPDGTEHWRLRTGGCTGSSPVLDEDGRLYFSLNNYQASISREGKLRWQRGSDVPMITSPATAANGCEYFSLPWLRLGAFDHAGGLHWEFQMKGNNLQSSPNLDAQGVIYACDGVSLFALKPVANAAPPAKSSWPMWRANAQHTGRVAK